MLILFLHVYFTPNWCALFANKWIFGRVVNKPFVLLPTKRGGKRRKITSRSLQQNTCRYGEEHSAERNCNYTHKQRRESVYEMKTAVTSMTLVVTRHVNNLPSPIFKKIRNLPMFRKEHYAFIFKVEWFYYLGHGGSKFLRNVRKPYQATQLTSK